MRVSKDSKLPGVYGRASLATPDGRVLGFGGGLEPYNGRFFPAEVYFSSFDARHNELAVTKVSGGPPCCPGEDRPFCFLPDRNQVFYYECVGGKDNIERQGTWVYDVKINAFRDLKPKRQPPGSPRTVEYVAGQDAVFAVVGDGSSGFTTLRTTPGRRSRWKARSRRSALPRPTCRSSTPPGTAYRLSGFAEPWHGDPPPGCGPDEVGRMIGACL